MTLWCSRYCVFSKFK